MRVSVVAKHANHISVMITDPGRQDMIQLQLRPNTISHAMLMQEVSQTLQSLERIQVVDPVIQTVRLVPGGRRVSSPYKQEAGTRRV